MEGMADRTPDRASGRGEDDGTEAELQIFARLLLGLKLPDACVPGVWASLADLFGHAERLRAFDADAGKGLRR